MRCAEVFKALDKEKIIKCIAAFIFPLFLCLLYCRIRGTSFWKLYLPSSINNDAFFYYKLVEGALMKGGIRGYFGYNESHALVGGFGAWTPFIIIPWMLWGYIFKWNYISPILNILLMFLTLSLFPALPIHIMNTLPETMILSLLLIYWGVCHMCCEKEKTQYFILMYSIGFFLTLLRPYYVLILLYPSIMLIKKRKWSTSLISVCIPITAVIGYLVSSHFFCSPYFIPLYNTDMIKHLFTGNIRDAVSSLNAVVSGEMSELSGFIRDAFDYGLTAGTQYVIVVFMMVTGLLLYGMKIEGRNVFLLYSVVTFGIMMAIIVLLGSVKQGGRHFFSFAVLGLILLCSVELRRRVIPVDIAAALLLMFFISRGSMIPTNYDIPIEIQGNRSADGYWREAFKEKNVQLTEILMRMMNIH